MKVGIVNYGVGNIRSLQMRFSMLKIESFVASTPAEVESADKLVLPGVGHFKSCMESLKASGLIPSLEKKVHALKTPLLGVCAGMQILFESSEEGQAEGLGWLKGHVVKFSEASGLRVPHVGWNRVVHDDGSKLLKGITSPSRFYFTHSYFVPWNANSHGVGKTEYGTDLMAVVESDSVFATQFHPEKSHEQGLRIFKNFSEML